MRIERSKLPASEAALKEPSQPAMVPDDIYVQDQEIHDKMFRTQSRRYVTKLRCVKDTFEDGSDDLSRRLMVSLCPATRISLAPL